MSLLTGTPKTENTVTSPDSSQLTMPDWYTNYAAQILANQGAVAAQPYTTYQGPRVAGFSGDTNAAFDATRAAAGATAPGIAQAQGYLSAGAGGSALSAAQGYFDRAANMSGVDAADPYLKSAASMSSVGAATPTLQQGLGYYGASTSPMGIQAASPFLSQAGLSSVSNIGSYMSPYTDQVVNRIGDLGARSLREKLLPQISDQFIGAGGYGGSRQAEAIGRAVRDTQESISAQQDQALESGYGTSLQAAQADQARQAQLAQTAGGLGAQQQQLLQGAGSGVSNIGQTLGNLTTAQQSTLSNIGQTYGNLTAEQQRILAGIGSSVGSLAAGDRDRQISAAGVGGNLATQAQTAGLQGAGALQAIGAQQENKTQQSLDLAYADFLRQQGYPQEQIDAMTKTFGGVQTGIPQYKEAAGGTKDVTTVGAGPSGLQSVVGGIGSIVDLNNKMGNPLGGLFGGGSPNYNLIGNVSQPVGITPQATLNPVSGLRL